MAGNLGDKDVPVVIKNLLVLHVFLLWGLSIQLVTDHNGQHLLHVWMLSLLVILEDLFHCLPKFLLDTVALLIGRCADDVGAFVLPDFFGFCQISTTQTCQFRKLHVLHHKFCTLKCLANV